MATLIDTSLRPNLTGTQDPRTSVEGFQDAFSESRKTKARSARIATTQAQLDQIKNTPIDQQAIFTSWKKISINSSLVFPAVAAETTAWRYDTPSKRFSNTTNSNTFIGAVSDKQYSDYSIEVKLTSTAADDDIIGMIIAFYQDPLTGRQYTLSANRSSGGWGAGNNYGIYYNFNQGSPGSQYTVAPGDHLVVTPSKNWNVLSGCLLKVVRKGDIIEVTTSQFSSANTLDEATKLTINLNSDPRLAVFKGASSYGYCALSQANSFWDVLSFTNPQDIIYDLRNSQIWKNNGKIWVLSNDPELKADPGSMITDTVSGEMVFRGSSSEYTKIATTSIPSKS